MQSPSRRPVVVRLGWCLLPAILGAAAALVLLLAAGDQIRPAYAGTLTFPACASTIQACIDSASPGATILISAGDYTESLTLSKAVSLTGELSSTTVLHALPNTRVLTVTGAAVSTNVVISGLTFTGGLVTGTLSCPNSCGGGILITDSAKPRLVNVIVVSNTARWKGGGLYADGSMELIGTQFLSNTVEGGTGCCPAGGGAQINLTTTLEGGLFQGNQCRGNCFAGGLGTTLLVMTGTQFLSNTAGFPGGGASAVNATLHGGLFQGNMCTDPACNGGGLNAFVALTATDALFIRNVAGHCGGGACAGSTAIIQGGLFLGNRCTSSGCRGGGLSAFASQFAVTGTQFISNEGGIGGALAQTSGAAGRVVNALFARNTGLDAGAGLYLNLVSSGNFIILHTTIASPTLGSGAAIFVLSGTLGITDTIISSYTIGISLTASFATEDYNLFFGNGADTTAGVTSGGHSLATDPGFLDPANDDYHLVEGSAAADTGINAGVTSDFEGDPRPWDSGFDIGFDEYFVPLKLYLPLALR